MSDPVAEQIMENVRTRMAAFTRAYRSAKIATWQPRDLVVHVHQGTITPNVELSCPGNPPAQAYNMEAIIAGIVKPSDTDPVPVDTYKNRLWSDIVRAATNADLWHQWGGLAINTTIGNAEEYTDDGGAAGIMVRFLITFRVSEYDPCEVRG